MTPNWKYDLVPIGCTDKLFSGLLNKPTILTNQPSFFLMESSLELEGLVIRF